MSDTFDVCFYLSKQPNSLHRLTIGTAGKAYVVSEIQAKVDLNPLQPVIVTDVPVIQLPLTLPIHSDTPPAVRWNAPELFERLELLAVGVSSEPLKHEPLAQPKAAEPAPAP